MFKTNIIKFITINTWKNIQHYKKKQQKNMEKHKKTDKTFLH